MLARLSIRDIVLIDRLDIDFASGLSVLTGETGAGKSILLDAFALALGARGDATLVRQGAEQGQVTAMFELAADHPARALLTESDIRPDDALILRRVQFADGRTRAFVNDQPVSVQALQSLGAALVEIHGQHDARALVDAATHRRLLDAYAALEGDAAAVARLWNARREAEAAVASHRADVERARARGRLAASCGRGIDRARAAAGRRNRAGGSSRQDDAGREGRRRSARSARRRRRQRIRRCRRSPPRCAGWSAAPRRRRACWSRRCRHSTRRSMRWRRRAAHLEAGVARGRSRPAGAGAHRGAAVRAARRGPQVQFAGRRPERAGREICRRSRADRCRRRTAGGAGKGGAAEAQAQFAKAAEALSEARRKGAQKLDKAVNAELKPLKLERAKFSTEIETDAAAAGPNGIDRVEFWVQTNPGTRPGPLIKVASGGELARFLLALKVVLADRGSAPTLVFDEIDTGVGGAVADAIGVRLAKLGHRRPGRDRYPCAAGRRARRAALPHHQGRARQGQAHGDPRHRAGRASGGARRSRACWPAPRSPKRRAPPPSG